MYWAPRLICCGDGGEYLDEEVLLLEAAARAELVRILAQVVGSVTVTVALDDLQRTIPVGQATFGTERGKTDGGRLGDAEKAY